MKSMTKFLNHIDKMANKTLSCDLSADEKAKVFGLKQDIQLAILKFYNFVNPIIKERSGCEYVIKLLENGEFIGYVDYYKTDDPECPFVPALVKDINEIENDVYPTIEAVEHEIKVLQMDADAYDSVLNEDSHLQYVYEKRK